MVARGWVLAALAASLLAATDRSAARAEDPSEPAAIVRLEKAVEATRTAPRADKTAVKTLSEALTAAEGRAKAVRALAAQGVTSARKNESFATAWNEAVTVMRYHTGGRSPAYILVPIGAFTSGGISLSIPVSGRWTHEYTGKNEQHLVTFTQRSAAKKPICIAKLWFYRWDTVYSGIGGENYVGLAKAIHEIDRDAVVGTGRRVSPRVIPVKINAAFPRAQYYLVEGFDVEERKTLRRRNYYLKDRSRTYCVEFVDHLDADASDDTIATWLRSDDCPERRAMLESIAPRGK